MTLKNGKMADGNYKLKKKIVILNSNNILQYCCYYCFSSNKWLVRIKINSKTLKNLTDPEPLKDGVHYI